MFFFINTNLTWGWGTELIHPTIQNTNSLCALFLQIANTPPLLKCGKRENNELHENHLTPSFFPDAIDIKRGRKKQKNHVEGKFIPWDLLPDSQNVKL